MTSSAFERHLVLHAVAVKKHGTLGEIAGLAGVPEPDCAAWLATLAETGRVIAGEGRYLLAPLARVALEGDYSRFWGNLRRDGAFLSAYDGFERINTQLKALITDWQTLEVGGTRIANDHSDKAHDEAVIDRLGALHEQAERVLAALAQASPRLAIYPRALTEALERAEDGAIEWVISTDQQDASSQKAMLEDLGAVVLFVDTGNGSKLTGRDQLEAALRLLDEGDTLLALHPDRLARDTGDGRGSSMNGRRSVSSNERPAVDLALSM